MHASERITVEEKVEDFELGLNLCIGWEKILLLVNNTKVHFLNLTLRKLSNALFCNTLKSKDLMPTAETWLETLVIV